MAIKQWDRLCQWFCAWAMAKLLPQSIKVMQIHAGDTIIIKYTGSRPLSMSHMNAIRDAWNKASSKLPKHQMMVFDNDLDVVHVRGSVDEQLPVFLGGNEQHNETYRNYVRSVRAQAPGSPQFKPCPCGCLGFISEQQDTSPDVVAASERA